MAELLRSRILHCLLPSRYLIENVFRAVPCLRGSTRSASSRPRALIPSATPMSALVINRHKRPIASHSERVFVRAKLLDPLAPKPHQSCARTNEPC